jgi:dihydroxyacetone kinase
MGPIYGTVFMEMGDRLDGVNMVTADVFADMLDAALNGVWEIVEAQVGDKTLIDVLAPARDAFRTAVNDGKGFAEALTDLKTAAEQGMLSTRDLVAKFGRSRLGRSGQGGSDAGSVSCNLLLQAMADGNRHNCWRNPHNTNQLTGGTTMIPNKKFEGTFTFSAKSRNYGPPTASDGGFGSVCSPRNPSGATGSAGRGPECRGGSGVAV